MITTIVVDDEAEPRQELRSLIEKNKGFKVIGECSNAFEAMKMINNEHPDVVFLDIRMPELTGIDMLSLLDRENIPRIVFVTAYEEYAVEAFRQNALDYLLKPINEEYLTATLSKLIDNCEPQPAAIKAFSDKPEFISVYHGKTDYRILVNDIVFASTKGSYSVIITAENSEHPLNYKGTLKDLTEIDSLERCHGQYVINMQKIQRLEKISDKNAGIIYTTTGHTIPIGRSFMRGFF